jgi:hypothetical protein
MAGLAEATAARAATMRVEKCMLAVDIRVVADSKNVLLVRMKSNLILIVSVSGKLERLDKGRTTVIFILFICSFRLPSRLIVLRSVPDAQQTAILSPFPDPLSPPSFPAPHFVLELMPSPC